MSLDNIEKPQTNQSANRGKEQKDSKKTGIKKWLMYFNSDPEWVHRSLPVIVLLMFMGLSYIYLTHKHVIALRSIQEYKAENQELRSELIAIQSDLMTQSKQSEIARRVQQIGLHEMRKPPYKIKAKK